jgi:hypothetical protein
MKAGGLLKWPSRPVAIQVPAMALVAIANFLVAAVVQPVFHGDAFWSVNWGIYAGEYLVVAIWVAWGRGSFFWRVGNGLLFGGAWGLCSWLGFIADQGRDAFVWRQEMLQSLYVPPIALAITTFPLALFRIFRNWQFLLPKTGPKRSQQITLKQIWLGISVLSIGIICLTWLPHRRMMDDVLVAAVVGVTTGLLALGICPLIVTGLLQTRLRLPLLLIPGFLAVLIPWGVAQMFPMPGPGAATVYPVLIAILLGITALAFLVAAVLVWRAAGYRLHRGRIPIEGEPALSEEDGTPT